MKPRLLISESHDFSKEARAVLQKHADLQLEDLDRKSLLAAISSADVLWVRLRTQIDHEVMAAAPNLKLIVTATTGQDHIDAEEAARRGIRILSLKGERDFLVDVKATAEFTIALMLSLMRRIPAAHAHASGGGWNRDLFKGRELYGATVGIIGYGRVGRLVAERLTAFGSDLVVTDPRGRVDDSQTHLRFVGLDELLPVSDIITIHVDLTPDTKGLVGDDALAALKPGAFLINTSRGELIDESALLRHLQSGDLGGAALDVLADERAPRGIDDPLRRYARSHDNLLLTPHIAGCTMESMEKTELHLARRLVDEIPKIFGLAPKAVAGGAS